jgi:hypothetical protein
MKGKITIVLLGLALVFGMIAASCDNGAYPTLDAKDEYTMWAYESSDNEIPDEPLSIIKGDALFTKLANYTDINAPGEPGYTRVKTFMITKVATPAPGDPKADKKTLYAGMPILVKNSAIP